MVSLSNSGEYIKFVKIFFIVFINTLQTARVNELNVVTADSRAPLARVTIVAKAGSRYENSSNLGVTHAIRHTAYLVRIAVTFSAFHIVG